MPSANTLKNLSDERLYVMAMSDMEINQVLEKLKDKYTDYSKKNPTWFNRDAFNERLIMAIKNNMNMEAFVLAEIANFEKVKEKYDKKKNRKSFSKQVERILDEHLARIKKYPEIRFHSKAGLEISHFYGALSDFALYYVAALYVVLLEKDQKDKLLALEGALHTLAVPRGKRHAMRIEDHITKLKRFDATEIEIERDKNEYLKESAFMLHEIMEFCDNLIESRNPEWENPLRMDKLFVEDQQKKRISHLFAGLTGYGAIMKVRDYAGAVIEDFRLGAFRRQG